MQTSITKFITRLSLPKNFTFRLRNCTEIENRYSANSMATLELYHACRGGMKSAHSIITNGFDINHRGNKGYGVYFANHSRYSAFWAGWNNPVIICHIRGDTKYIKRYKSEYKSPHWDSEYVVTDQDLIFPKYILEYTLENNDVTNDFNELGYVVHGNFGCDICDKKIIRCNCRQFPTLHPDDLINEL